MEPALSYGWESPLRIAVLVRDRRRVMVLEEEPGEQAVRRLGRPPRDGLEALRAMADARGERPAN
jgi:hypothetical protein